MTRDRGVFVVSQHDTLRCLGTLRSDATALCAVPARTGGDSAVALFVAARGSVIALDRSANELWQTALPGALSIDSLWFAGLSDTNTGMMETILLTASLAICWTDVR